MGNEGHDTVYASVSHKLGANIEDLWFTSETAANIVGNELSNRLTGNGNNNVINGLGGADRMFGMGGNDTYYVDDQNDLVLERR